MDVMEKLLHKFKGWENAEAVLIRFPARYYTMDGLSAAEAKAMRREPVVVSHDHQHELVTSRDCRA